MVGIEAFDLINMKILTDNTISWSGRILNDIKLHDKLYLKYGKKEYKYVVKKIIAYKVSFEEISKGMSAELIVSGPKVEFKPYTIFYFKDKINDNLNL